MARSRPPPQSRRCSTAWALPDGLAFDHPIADVRREANDSGGNVGPIKVDLFFPAVEYLEGVMTRRTELPLLGREVPVVGLNDLVVMKTVFGRTKGFADIETLARHGREPIDREFVGKHVREILHPDDAKGRLEALGRYLDNETDASRAGRSPR